MGKLLGLPMGCDGCYINHAVADQNSADNARGIAPAAAAVRILRLAERLMQFQISGVAIKEQIEEQAGGEGANRLLSPESHPAVPTAQEEQ